VGTMQGDPASGIWFNAGLQRAYNLLREEFPETIMAKYLDDLNVFVPPNADGTPRTCSPFEPRTLSFPGCFVNKDGCISPRIPLARAIAHRWKYLAFTMCGLSVKDKWGACSISTTLSDAEYGDVDETKIPLPIGLTITGTPIGPSQFIRETISSAIEQSVKPTFEAVSSLRLAQIRNLLARSTCGTSRIQHLLQTIRPSITSPTAAEVDLLIEQSVASTMGITVNDLDALNYKQLHLPIRFGGLGYRSSRDIVHEAFVASFAMSAYSTPFNIGTIAPFLADAIAKPELHNLSSLQELSSSWEYICRNRPRITALAKAAIVGVVRPPVTDPSEADDPSQWERILLNQESVFECRFKSQVVRGVPPEDNSTSWLQSIQDITDRADKAFRNITPISQLQTDHYSEPWKYPSVMLRWIEQGAKKLQHTFSRIADTHRLLNFTSECTQYSKLRATIFRAKQNPFSSIPLTILPNKPERIFNNAEFQWFLADKLQASQPCSSDLSTLRCDCTSHPIIGSGRHFRLCTNTHRSIHIQFHNKMRDELILFCRSAGLPTVKEPENLIPDDPLLRPADLYIPHWTIDGQIHSRHAVDFTAPSIDSAWVNITQLEQDRRCSTAGFMASSAVKTKLAHKFHPTDNHTISSQCHHQNIHYWPIALEKDGCSSASFRAFLKHVCNAAGKFTGQDTLAFRNYWLARLGCQFHHSLAALSLRRSMVFRRNLLRLHTNDLIVDNCNEPQMELPVHSVGPLTALQIT
jgi:hypothetical protein